MVRPISAAGTSDPGAASLGNCEPGELLVLGPDLRVESASERLSAAFGRVPRPGEDARAALGESLELVLSRPRGSRQARFESGPCLMSWSHDAQRVFVWIQPLPAAVSVAPALAGMVSHETRNPLASVKMVVQTLARGPGLDERTLRRLAIASREVRTIEHVMTAFTELSKEGQACHQRCEVPILLAEVVQGCERELADWGVRVELVAEEVLEPVAADRERLKLALMHLLWAAAARASGRPLELGAKDSGGAVTIWLGGLAPESAPKDGVSIALVGKVARELGGWFRIARTRQEPAYTLFLPVASGRGP